MPAALALALVGAFDKALELALIVIKDIPEDRRRAFWENHFERQDRIWAAVDRIFSADARVTQGLEAHVIDVIDTAADSLKDH